MAFDHELSLGGTDSYERNLFEPTEALLATAEEAGVPVVLFTDVLCAIKHEEWGIDEFVRPYRAQIVRALRAGHDAQLHLHPHWLTSQWSEGRFVPSRDFALDDFSTQTSPYSIESIVANGTHYLQELCESADAAYRCRAFRAGGYNMAPSTERILRALYANGIRIDSSLIRGFYFASGISTIDFRGVTSAANWCIPLEGPLDATASRGMFEVPIVSARRSPLNNVPFLVRRVVHRKRLRSDGGRSIHDASTSKIEKMKRLFPRSAWSLSFDNYADRAKDLLAIFRSYVRAHRGEREIVCASVSHPKSMGSHARDVMREFIARAREVYGEDLEFTTFSEIYGNTIAEPSGDK
ncbi:MAG: hypothetical protein ABI282_09980 [Candidatus Baltobacteraceae bacterium]